MHKHNLRLIYTNHFIQNLALSIYDIFIPIYLLDLGYNIQDIIIFFIASTLNICIFSFITIYLTKFISLPKIIIFRFPFLFVFLGLILLLKNISTPLIIIGIFHGAAIALYYIPLNILLSQNINKNEMGSSLGKFIAISKIIRIFAPFLSSIIITFYSFKVLFIIVLMFLIIAFIPILKLKSTNNSYQLKKQSIKKTSRKNYKLLFNESIKTMGVYIVEGIVWPIFIYINLINIISIGFIASLISLSSAIFAIFIGKLSNKIQQKNLIKIGVILMSFTWVLKYFFQNEIFFYLLSILSGFLIILINIPFDSLILKRSQKEDLANFFITREIYLCVGRLTMLIIVLFLVNNLKYSFLIISFFYLYLLFL